MIFNIYIWHFKKEESKQRLPKKILKKEAIKRFLMKKNQKQDENEFFLAFSGTQF